MANVEEVAASLTAFEHFSAGTARKYIMISGKVQRCKAAFSELQGCV